MERMGDILARAAIRRAREVRATADAERAPDQATAPASSVPPRPLSTGAPRLLSGARRIKPGPAGRNTPTLGRAASVPTRAASPVSRPAFPPDTAPTQITGRAARPDVLEEPPGMPVPSGAARRVAPPDARSHALGDDRVLELPPRRAMGAARAQGPVDAGGAGGAVPASPRPAMGAPGGRPQPASAPAAGATPPPISARRSSAGPLQASQGTPAQAATSGKKTLREASADYASGSAVCPICGGAGYVRLEVAVGDPAFGKPVPCECKERQFEDRRRSDLRRLSSLEPFQESTFDRFDSSVQGVREAFEAASAYAAQPDGWLVLSGPHGVGKTHLAAAIAHEQLSRGTLVVFAIVPDLLDHLRAAFAPTSEVPYDELFDKVREAGLLVLDDLGAENSTAWATEKLFQLINYRYNFRMPTVITTNTRLLSQMDERIRSRLSDIGLTRHCAVKAQDYREHRTRRPGSSGARPRQQR